MTIKNLWDKQKQGDLANKSANLQTVQDFFSEVESENFLQEYQKSKNLYLQDVNFATASNFAKFGSARKYYENIVNRITGYFPYDGSKSDQLEFENNLNPFEKYIYLYEYPRSTGYINFSPNGWGTRTLVSGGIGLSDSVEYISFYNENHDNVYDPNNGLIENTRFIFSSGSTVEFWLKKSGFPSISTQTSRETIFYTATTGSNDKDKRLTIYIPTNVSTSSISTAYYTNTPSLTQEFVLTFDTGLTTLADSQWHHYCLVYYTGSSGNYSVDFYFDGIYKETKTNSGTVKDITGSAFNTIGALGGKLTTSTDLLGYGKLSGSIDEFRFWNTKRNAKQIGLNYFVNVGGGNNVSGNSGIGVYYKFNEGILGNSSTDSIILDYAGRSCNGLFVGYNSNSRNTGSAITETQEYPEIGTPILYSTNANVQNYLTERLYYADEHDFKNNFMLKNSMPSWILDDDANNGEILTNFLQTLSSYLDTLYLQITKYKDIKNKEYINYEGKAPPFSDLLLTSHGFDLPSLFLNTDIVQSFLNQDNKRTYDQNIDDLKNIIYKNIYNNLEIIYKSKGTENSIKQLIKTFGVNQDVFNLNIYANNTQYKLENSYVNKSIKKSYVDLTPFTYAKNSTAVIYQSGSNSFITGTNYNSLSFTAECDVIIPEFPKDYDYLSYQTYNYNTASIFGIRTATDNNSEINVSGSDPASLKIYLNFRDDKGYFSLSHPNVNLTLTSSVFVDLLKDQHWNLSVRLIPVSTGSSFNLIFSGYSNFVSDQFREFSVSSSLTTAQGNNLLSKNKRLYVGAERTNITGTLQYPSLVKALSAKYWADYLEDDELKEHARNPDNYGRLNPYEPYELATGSYIPKSETLVLHWDFTNITSSNSNGSVPVIYDLTSGSTAGNSYSNFPISNLVGRLYNGAGYGFEESATVGGLELVYSSEQQLPENLYSNQLINILATDDDYYTTEIRPQKYFFSLENSMYDVISKNMLNMFASIVEFNNFIGQPLNTYKSQYSKLKFFRKLFFNKIGNAPDLDKYVGIYKWIDDALDSILFNLLPASANASEKVRTIVENHILERNKFQYNLLPDKSPIIIGGANTNPGGSNFGSWPPGLPYVIIFPLIPFIDIVLYPIPKPKIPEERKIVDAEKNRVIYINEPSLNSTIGSAIIRYEMPSTDNLNEFGTNKFRKSTIAAKIGRTR